MRYLVGVAVVWIPREIKRLEEEVWWSYVTSVAQHSLGLKYVVMSALYVNLALEIVQRIQNHA